MSQRRPTEAEIRDARRLLGVGPGAPRAIILKAWRAAVRRSHPDAAPERDRIRAEALCSRINAAKDMLLQHPSNAPGSGGGGNRNGRATAAGVTRPARPAGPARSGMPGTSPGSTGSAGDYIPTGVPAGVGLVPPRTWLLLTFLVVGFLALLSILAMTTHDDEGLQGSRIGGTSAASSATAGVAAPSEAMAVLLAADGGQIGDLERLSTPATRHTDVEDIMARISQADPSTRTQARSSIRCDTFQPGIADRASCSIGTPADLLPHPVELRRVDGSWRVLGYLTGR